MKTNLYKSLGLLGFSIFLLALISIPRTAYAQVPVTIGTGTSVNTTSGVPSPYALYYTGDKSQYLITAAELLTAGASSGTFLSVAFNVQTPEPATSNGSHMKNYTLKMKQTSVTALTSTFETGLTQVFTTASYASTVGWNTHTFTTPFFWDGTSNIVLEICFDNFVTTYDYSSNALAYYTAGPTASAHYYRSDAGGVCPYVSGGTIHANRPNMQFMVQTQTYANDLKLDAWVSPVSVATPSATMPIVVRVKNNGSATQTAIPVKYSINGGQTLVSQTFNASLASGDTASFTFTQTANMSASQLYNCMAYTSLAGDSNGYNDTVRLNVWAGVPLSGVYTIGPDTNDDFSSFTAAAGAISNFGVAGQVTFSVDPGTYTEFFEIGAVTNASAANTITFQSSTGNRNDVILTSTNAAYTIKLNNADYVGFKNMTIKNTNASNTAVILMTNGTSYANIENNIIQGVNTTSSSNRVIDAYANYGGWNIFKNNYISGGYYGMTVRGSSTSLLDKYNVVTGNEITNFYLYGLYTYYQDSIKISGNYIYGGTNTYHYGLYAAYSFNGFEITKNKVILSPSSYGYGLYSYYNNYSTYAPANNAAGLVANNFVAITSGTSTSYGLYASYCDNVKYYHNSVNIAAGGTSSRALYQTNTTTTTTNTIGESYYNNIFATTGGGGFAAYFATVAKVANSDYNAYYTNGTILAYWGANKNTLADLQSASSKDTYSVTKNPVFASSSDLHLNDAVLNGAAMVLTEITDDIDGDVRTSTPDIGADEFTPITDDAGVVAFSGISGACPNTSTNIIASVKNYGIDTIYSFGVNWSVNGVAQTAYTNSTDTILPGNTKQFTIGTYTLAPMTAYDFKAWSILPNGVADMKTTNDTLLITGRKAALAGGTYTIGTGAYDFQTLAAAANDITANGICGPVVFNVYPGTYTGQILINSVVGVSAVNTITFKSVNGDKANTIIEYNNTATSEYSNIIIKSTDYVTFKDFTINATGSTYAQAFQIDNGADYVTIDGNIMNMPSTASSVRGVYSATGINNYLTITNNVFNGSYQSIYVYGSSTQLVEGAKINNNQINNYFYYGIYTYYTDSMEQIGNVVSSALNTITYGITNYYVFNGFNISKNIVRSGASNYAYGLRVGYANYYSSSFATNAAPGLVSNNYVYNYNGSSASVGYGMYLYYNNNTNVYNNTAVMNCGSSTARAMYQANTTSNTLGENYKNNIFANFAGGFAAYYSTVASVTSADYNNYYTNGTVLAYWGANKSTLADLQTASSKDVYSVSIDPGFFQSNDYKLYINSAAMPGTVLAEVTTDIENQPRTATPDMGCDEFVPADHDLSVFDFLSPVSGPCGSAADSVYIGVVNFGANAETNFPVYITGTTPNGTFSANAIIPNLASGASADLYFGLMNTTYPGTYSFKVYSALTTDTLKGNDTLYVSFTRDVPTPVDYSEGFSTWPATGWDAVGNGTFTWQSYGGSAIYANFWSFTAGNVCETYSPLITLDAAKTNYIGFKHAYFVNTSYNDTLEVAIQTCSMDTVLWRKGGSQLQTTGGGYTTAGDYVSNLIQIPASFNGQNVKVVLRGISNYGPDLYVDQFDVFAAPSVNLGADAAICAGDSVTFDAGAGNFTYLWKLGVDTIANSQTITANATGSYTVEKAFYGVVAYDTVNLVVNALPTVSFSGLAADYCINGTASTLVGAPVGGTFSGMGIIGNDFNPATAGLGAIAVTYTYTDANNCTNSAVSSANVNPAPVATASADVTICEGTSTTLSVAVAATTSDLFFSEYIEGSSNNKGFEIYNGTGQTVSLDNYQIAQATNGGGWSFYHVFPAGATLANGDVWVIVANQINASVYDTANADESLAYPSVSHHNGDDARALIKITPTDTLWLDLIGDPNNDPGTGWAVAGVANATVDHTLIRKSTVLGPNFNWTTSAGTDSTNSEWVIMANNYTSNLGIHMATGTGIYLWSNGDTTDAITVSPTTTTTYTVAVSNGYSCSVVDTVVVTVNPKPVVNLGADVTLCASESTTLDAGAGFSYLWNTTETTQTITVDSTGTGVGTATYYVDITDANTCTNSDTINVTFLAEPVVNILGSDTVKYTHSTTLDAGNGFASYLWSNGWTSQSLVFGGSTLNNNANNTYSIIVTDANGCYGYDTITFFVIDDTGLGEIALDAKVGVTPNPNNGKFQLTIDGYSGSLNMSIIDLSGKVIYSEDLNVNGSFSKDFEMNSIAKGVYYVKLSSPNGVKVGKLIVQ